MWNDIIPYTFKEIATEIKNLEQRRIAINCLGINRLVAEINPILRRTDTISKQTTWVEADGKLVTRNYEDTYELYEVSSDLWEKDLVNLRGYRARAFHYIKCKDTSTDRDYLIWVNAQDVYATNDKREDTRWYSSDENYGSLINAIQCVAWTIQTDIEKGGIDKIVRQGDCILIKPKANAKSGDVRHLTEDEYRELLVLES